MSHQGEVGGEAAATPVVRAAQLWSGRHTLGLRSVAVTATLLTICLLAGPAEAAPDDDWLSPADPPESTEVDQEPGGGEVRRDWYRTALAVTYLVPMTVMSVGIADRDEWVVWMGVAGLIAPPIMHWAHGNVGRGFLSLGGMVALGLTGVAIGDGAAEQAGPKADDAVFAGALVGIALWGTADVVYLAYDDVPVEQSAAIVPWASPVVSGGSGPGVDGQAASEITGVQIGALGRF